MKKHIKKIIIILIILGLLYFLYTKFFSSNTDLNSEKNGGDFGPIGNLEVKVEKKDFVSSLNFDGTTKLKNEQKLRFNRDGRVITLNGKVGDNVKKGEILAKINSSEVQTEIEREKLNVSNSKDKLQKFIDEINDIGIKKVNLDIASLKINLTQKEYNISYLQNKQSKDFKIAESNLKELENNLEIEKKEIEKNISKLKLNSQDRDKLIKDKKLEIDKVQRKYDEFKKNYNDKKIKKINEYNGKLETNYFYIDTEIENLETTLKEASKIIGINDDGDNFEYSTYFSAKKSLNQGEIKKYLYISLEKYKELKKSFENIKDKKDAENIIKTLEINRDFYESFYKASAFLAKGFKDSVPTTGFSEGYISSSESLYASKSIEAKGKITSLTTTIDDLKTTDSIDKIEKDLMEEFENLGNNLETLKLDFQKLEDNQDYIVNTSDNNIISEKLKLEKSLNNIDIQKLDLEKLKMTHKDELAQEKISLEKLKLDYKDLIDKRDKLLKLSLNNEYKLLKNDVKQTEVNLENAYKKLEDYILTAPFDGVITKVDINLGDRLNADTQKFISVVDPNAIEVNVSINQTDIVKVKKGMEATIKLSAYPDKVFSGVLTELDTTPKEDGNITQFPAKIVLKKPDDIKLYSGMKAKVEIFSNNIKDAIVIPFTAVETGEDEKKYVTVINNGNKEKREVEIGYTDGEYYEIKSGLKPGEKVLEIDYAGASNFKLETKGDMGLESTDIIEG